MRHEEMNEGSDDDQLRGGLDDDQLRSLDDEAADELAAGDDTVETEATVFCPYCGEINEIGLDPGGGRLQEYVEDCQVCCRPWRVVVNYLPDGTADVSVEAESLD